MYEDFYQLKADPFRLSPDHAFCFHYPSFTKAKAYMRYALNAAEGFVLVTGLPGMGKTTLISDLLSDLADTDDYLTGMLVNTQLEATPLLRMVAYEFGLQVQDQDKATVLQKLNKFFIEVSQSHRRPLLIVDEAQNLQLEALEELRLLTNLQFENRPLLQIFLVGQEMLRDKLNDPRLEQLRQRITAACHLDPLTVEQATAYIIHRLRVVGWNGVPKLTAPTFRVIQKISGGIPRRINQFCSRLLLHGSLEEKFQLSPEDAEVVVTELEEEHLIPAASEHDFLADALTPGTASGNAESSFSDETLLQRAEDLLLQQANTNKKLRPAPRIGGTNRSPGEGDGLTKKRQSPLLPTLTEPKIIAPAAAREPPTTKGRDEPDSESRYVVKDSGTPKPPKSTRLRNNLLSLGRTASVPLRHTIASLALATQQFLKWLDGVSDTLASGLRHTASVLLRHTIASSALATRRFLKWLDGVSDTLASGLRRLGTYRPRPRRHSGHTPAPTPSGDDAPSLRSPWRAANDLFSALSRRPVVAYTTVILLIVAIPLFTLPGHYLKKWVPDTLSVANSHVKPQSRNPNDKPQPRVERPTAVPDQNELAGWKNDSKSSPVKANPPKLAAGPEPATTETKKPLRSTEITRLAIADHRQAQAFKARVARDLTNGSVQQRSVQREPAAPKIALASATANAPSTGADVETQSQPVETGNPRPLVEMLAGMAKPSEPEVRRIPPRDDQSGIMDRTKALAPKSLMVREVTFGFNSTKISPQARSLLNKVTTRMKESNKWMAHIVGYTDSVGPKKYNQHLSKLRANVVATYLSSQGISYNRLRIEGRGPLEPLPHEDDATSGQQSKRLVRIVLEPHN